MRNLVILFLIVLSIQVYGLESNSKNTKHVKVPDKFLGVSLFASSSKMKTVLSRRFEFVTKKVGEPSLNIYKGQFATYKDAFITVATFKNKVVLVAVTIDLDPARFKRQYDDMAIVLRAKYGKPKENSFKYKDSYSKKMRIYPIPYNSAGKNTLIYSKWQAKKTSLTLKIDEDRALGLYYSNDDAIKKMRIYIRERRKNDL